MSHHTSRRQTAVIAALLLMLALVGCGPTGPITNPTPTPSASEDPVEIAIREAKAATVAYIDAISATRPENPKTLEVLYSLTTGTQHENDEKVYDQMKADGWSIEGALRLTLIEATLESASETNAVVSICVDAADYRFFDETGTERIPPRESTVQSVDVHLVSSSGRWLVEELTPREGAPTCS